MHTELPQPTTVWL